MQKRVEHCESSMKKQATQNPHPKGNTKTPPDGYPVSRTSRPVWSRLISALSKLNMCTGGMKAIQGKGIARKRKDHITARSSDEMECKAEHDLRRRGLGYTDYMNNLPDDILWHILCFLPLKEAQRTSVLSKRWQHLWTYHPILDFCVQVEEHLYERPEYVSWVNQVLASHKGSTIDAFSATFPKYDHISKQNIDAWIHFAIQKHVRKLHLKPSFYIFPWLHPQEVSSIRFLADLHLEHIVISEDLLGCILMESKFLERVVMIKCYFAHLKVAAPGTTTLLKLKYLHFYNCIRLRSIEIYAYTPELVSLRLEYSHHDGLTLHLQDAPQLRAVGFRIDAYTTSGPLPFPFPWRYLTQIHTFHLDLHWHPIDAREEIPKLTSLKNLVVRYWGFSYHQILLNLAKLLKAAPILEKLAVETTPYEIKFRGYKVWPKLSTSEVSRCLRVLKIVQFKGTTYDIESISYLLDRVDSLQKLIIDPRRPIILPLEERDEEILPLHSWQLPYNS